jgi:hypothetical protein
MSLFAGSCHCGAVSVRFETDLDAASIEVRADQCGFCRRHGAKTVSDPRGRLTLGFREVDIDRYRFGTRATDFIVCRSCHAYIAAIIDGFGVLNVVGANVTPLAARAATPVDYDTETALQRVDRRRARWTPVTLELAA